MSNELDVSPSLLSVSKTAVRIEKSRATTYRWVKEGVLPSVRIGGSICIPSAALDTWLAEKEKAALAAVKAN